MGSAVVEKTEQELRKEIEELHRQQWEITERLRDPRGLRRGGFTGSGPRNFTANGPVRQRGFVRPAERTDNEDQPAPKRRLSSAVVKIEEGEIIEDTPVKNDRTTDSAADESVGGAVDDQSNGRPSSWSRRDVNWRQSKDSGLPSTEPIPRVLPKDEDPKLVSRNRRMLGQLLGTLEIGVLENMRKEVLQGTLELQKRVRGLQAHRSPASSLSMNHTPLSHSHREQLQSKKFRKEDAKLSGSEAFARRSDSLKRAEQRAREESERLRQQEREQIAEKRKRDLTLRARVAAKAEGKKMELLFLRWSEHHKKLGNFLRTKAEPPIYYSFAKPMDENASTLEQQKEQIFEEWKTARREELAQYQKEIDEQYIANVEKELESWQNARKPRKGNNEMQNLQETMDKELETHRLEHGPKTRVIPGNNNEDEEEDVEDINVADDDMMDDVLDVDDNNRRIEEIVKPEAGNLSPNLDNKE